MNSFHQLPAVLSGHGIVSKNDLSQSRPPSIPPEFFAK
jgi:hypothetical protein